MFEFRRTNERQTYVAKKKATKATRHNSVAVQLRSEVVELFDQTLKKEKGKPSSSKISKCKPSNKHENSRLLDDWTSKPFVHTNQDKHKKITTEQSQSDTTPPQISIEIDNKFLNNNQNEQQICSKEYKDIYQKIITQRSQSDTKLSPRNKIKIGTKIDNKYKRSLSENVTRSENCETKVNYKIDISDIKKMYETKNPTTEPKRSNISRGIESKQIKEKTFNLNNTNVNTIDNKDNKKVITRNTLDKKDPIQQNVNIENNSKEETEEILPRKRSIFKDPHKGRIFELVEAINCIGPNLLISEIIIERKSMDVNDQNYKGNGLLVEELCDNETQSCFYPDDPSEIQDSDITEPAKLISAINMHFPCSDSKDETLPSSEHVTNVSRNNSFVHSNKKRSFIENEENNNQLIQLDSSIKSQSFLFNQELKQDNSLTSDEEANIILGYEQTQPNNNDQTYVHHQELKHEIMQEDLDSDEETNIALEHISKTKSVNDDETENVIEPKESKQEIVLDDQDQQIIDHKVTKKNKVEDYQIDLSVGKIKYIVEELQTTELRYIEDLDVILIYRKYLYETHKMPILEIYALFGNIRDIYEKQVRFKNCLLDTNQNINEILNLFLKMEELFECYPEYCLIKEKNVKQIQKYQQLLEEKQNELRHKLGLSSYLLVPIQRLGKYILLLENIGKELNKNNKPKNKKLEDTINMLKKYMNLGNTSVALDSIADHNLLSKDCGKLVMKDTLDVWHKKRKMEMEVFLFENVLIFTTKNGPNQFKYLDSIKMDALTIKENKESKQIVLHDYQKNKIFHNKNVFVITSTNAQQIRKWAQNLLELLWKQLTNAKENQVATPVPYNQVKINNTVRAAKLKKHNSVFYTFKET